MLFDATSVPPAAAQPAVSPAPLAPPGLTPAAAVAAASGLAPRLLALAAETDVAGGFPAQAFAELRAAGLLTATLPPELGGAGLHLPRHTLALLQVLQAVGRGNLAVGRVFEGHLNALMLIQLFGSAAQVARAAADARVGRLFGVWNTEVPAEGVRLEALPGGRYRLHGAKTFASGAGHLSRPLITGRLLLPASNLGQNPVPGGWQLFVLPADAQPPALDRSFWRPLGMRATASFRADLTGLEIGPDDLIGPPDSYYRQPWFSGGAMRFAAVQLGGAEAIYDETRRFLQRLHRTGDPYQRQRLGQLAIGIESGRLWLQGAAAQAALPATAAAPTAEAAEAAVSYANMTRSAIESICLETMRLSELCVGARGLLQPEHFERLHRDLTHYLRQPATDAALADVGRYVLEHPSQRTL